MGEGAYCHNCRPQVGCLGMSTALTPSLMCAQPLSLFQIPKQTFRVAMASQGLLWYHKEAAYTPTQPHAHDTCYPCDPRDPSDHDTHQHCYTHNACNHMRTINKKTPHSGPPHHTTVNGGLDAGRNINLYQPNYPYPYHSEGGPLDRSKGRKKDPRMFCKEVLYAPAAPKVSLQGRKPI